MTNVIDCLVCGFVQKEEPNISDREDDSDITENLMLTHNEFLSTLQSRLTKLQVSILASFLFFSLTIICFSISLQVVDF